MSTPMQPNGAPQPQPYPVPFPAPVYVLPGVPVYPYVRVRPASVGQIVLAGLLDIVLSFLLLGIGWVVWALVAAGSGKTPGKQVMGLKVVDKTTGQTLSWGTFVLLRGFVGTSLVQGIVFPLTLGILWFMPLWDSHNQSLAGKVSNSVVVPR